MIMSTIVLDTCIVDYLLKAKSSSAMGLVLKKIIQDHSVEEFVISDFTKFECLRGVIKIKEVNDYLEKYKTVKVSSEILKVSAFLYSVCRNSNGKYRGGDDGDCIIGATAFLMAEFGNSFVLTADGGGFPRPFFIEAANDEIKYEDDSKPKRHDIFLLKPNWKALSEKLIAHREK